MTKRCTLCYNEIVCCKRCLEEKTGVQLCRECPADPLERNTQRHRILCCDIIMKTNCNRDQFKRIFSFFAAVLLVGMYAAGFAWVWYESYSSAILLPFYRRGNWVMILIYVVLVLLFAKSFGGLKIGYLKRTDMFYSQTLSIFCVNVVTYFQISVVNRDFSATVPMVLLTIVDLAVLILWIVLTNKLYFRLYPPRKLVVIYGDRNAAELVLKMSRRVDKYMICESVSASAPPEEIREAISRYEGIILCEVSGRLRNDLIKYCFAQNVRAYIAPKISDIILRGAEEIRLFDTPLLLCRNYGLTFEQKLGKRIFDLVFAVVFLVILSPVMLASAIAIKLDDGRPVLFKQKRLTYHGKEFYVYKFRSMVVDAEKSGPQLAKENDSRITKVGRILRKCRLDELPQLINILRGDMSVVGPRPERPELAEEYEKTMPEFEFRLQVKAGLTGYAQVTGLYDTLPYDKLKMDLMYIENYSIFMDLRIILMTLKTALFPGETNEEANAHDAQELLYQEEQIQEQEKEKGDHS